jgi:preprotein translocase subunit YajC
MPLIPFAVLLAKTTTKTSSASSLLPLLFFIAIGFILWRFYLKPRTQAAQNQRTAMSMLDIGDEVLTSSGIIGTVIELETDRVTLETGPGTQITVIRSAITRRLDPHVADSPSDLGRDLDDDRHDLDDSVHDHEDLADHDDADHDVVDDGASAAHDVDDHDAADAPDEATSPETNGSARPGGFDPFEGAVPKRRRRGSRRPGGTPPQEAPDADDAGSGDASS